MRVRAVGVNYADCIVRMGLYASAREYVGWPIVPGFEVAGEVDALGEGVADLAPGERVFAVTRFGAYATRVCVPRAQVFRVPSRFDLQQAAAFPAAYLTAYYAAMELARLRRGSTILVHSAAGGVGSALVEMGKIAGARVVGVVGSSAKVEHVRALGAHAVIDKSSARLWREAERLAPNGYDAIFDANGVETLRASYAHLASPGKLVVYGFHSMLPRARPTGDGSRGRVRWGKLALDWLRTPRFDPLDMTSANRSVLAFNLSYLFERPELLEEGMRALLAWAEDGTIAPPKVTAFPFDEVARAHRALETGTTTGKLVLVV